MIKKSYLIAVISALALTIYHTEALAQAAACNQMIACSGQCILKPAWEQNSCILGCEESAGNPTCPS